MKQLAVLHHIPHRNLWVVDVLPAVRVPLLLPLGEEKLKISRFEQVHRL